MGELFLPAGGKSTEANCQLQSAAREDELDSSELLFGGRGAAAAANSVGSGASTGVDRVPSVSSMGTAAAGVAAGVGQTAEAAAWRRGSKGMVDRLSALSSGQVCVTSHRAKA